MTHGPAASELEDVALNWLRQLLEQGKVRRAIEIAYVVLATTPTVGVVALQWLTPGSLVSGLAVGAAVPALAAAGVALMGVGSLLVLRARRQRHRARLLSLGIGLAGVMPLLLGLTWLFG